MLQKLFGKKEQVQTATVAEPTYTVQDIHDEFDAAEDMLLDEAKQILSNLEISAETELEKKAQMLKELGFHKNPDIARFDKIKKDKADVYKKIAANKEQAELIQYYRQNYPFMKFITEDELDRICEKYGLIYASVGNYKMDVPDKNLKEIAEASKKPLEPAYKPKNVNVIVVSCKESCPKEFKNFFVEPLITDDQSLLQYIRSGTPTYYAKIAKIGYSGEMPNSADYTISVDTFCKDGLQIAAPDTHFDMEELQKVTEYGFQSKTACVVPDDPIVFRFCKGGAQIISKWGAEASDESLVNEKMN